jgi:hypothetical protein
LLIIETLIEQVEHSFVEPGVLEHLQELNRQSSDDSYSSPAEPTSEPENQKKGVQADKSGSNNHIRETSQDDDDEEIVYTPPP